MPIQSSNPPDLHTLGPWKGLNQQARRGSIDDDEEWWNENLFAIGPGNLRSCWGHGPSIYRAPPGTQILRVFFGYYGNTTAQYSAPPPGRLGWMFLSNGHIDEVDLDTRQVRHVGPIANIAATTVTGTATSATANQLDLVGVTGTIEIGATIVFVNVVDTGVTVVNQQFGAPGSDGRYAFSQEIDLTNAQVQFFELAASATGTSAGTNSIDLTGVTGGTIQIGATVSLGGVIDPNLTVTGQQSGVPGGDGTYSLSQVTSLNAAELQFYDIGASGMATTAGPNTVTITGLSGALQAGMIANDDPNLVVTTQNSGAAGGDGIYTLTQPTTFQATPVSFTMGDPYFVWQPIAPWYWASAKVWRPQFVGNVVGQAGGVLFGSPQGLYAWDGTLYSPGDTAPDWLTDQQETVPGPPIFTMPIGLPGIYCMEVYQSRLFVAGKDVISFSAPSNGADFSTTDGGGSFGYFGDRLTYSYHDLSQTGGYLFVFGDSSIDMISNVQLSGNGLPESPFTTNMNYQNIDPQVGHRFPRPVGRIGRFFQMFNGAGIFEMRGGEATEIGQKTTNIYDTLDPAPFFPTMAPATMFGFKVLLCNGMFTDPFGVKRSLLLMYHPSGQNGLAPFWSVASQNLNLTNIGSYEQDSVIWPYGTDGTDLYQLFAGPDPNLIKRLSSKYIRGNQLAQLTIKNWKRLFLEVYDNTTNQGVAFTGTFTSSAGGVPGGVEDIGFQIPAGQRYAILPQAISGQGIAGAVDLISYSHDFTIERLHIVTEERTLWGA